MKSASLINLSDKSIFIVGAGWSGLACAVTLVQAGHKVCLLESARQAGGRARSISSKNSHTMHLPGLKLDNGQHIMLGAYYFTQEIFKTLGLKESNILQRHPLELKLFSAAEDSIHLKASSLLPAPLHLLAAFLTMQGLNLKDRLKVIKMALMLSMSGYRLKKDISVEQLLAQHQQTKILIKALWEPLCLATLNTPIHYASAQVFLNVLKDSFNSSKHNSDCLFFKQDLSQTFCLPAIRFIKNHNSEVKCAEKVLDIQIRHSGVNKNSSEFYIQTGHHFYQCNQLILATPPHISKKLIDQSLLIGKKSSFNFFYEPIVTIYIQYPSEIKLPQIMVGFFSSSSEHTSQWAIDRSLTGQNGLIAVVISGSGKHMQLSSSQLVHAIHQELSLVISHLPDFHEYKIIKEKRATFRCHVDIESQRPGTITTVSGLYLAGDYTDTGYPATLEGAIKSGVMAARQIIRQK